MQYLEGTQQAFVHRHHCAGVVEFAAVVRGREERDELSLGEEFVAVFHDLVRSADQVHVVFLEEARDDVRTECEAHAAVVLGPAGDVFVGVGPQ